MQFAGFDAVQQRNFRSIFLVKHRMMIFALILAFDLSLFNKVVKILRTENLNPVASFLLCTVQRFVGGLYQSINIIGNFGRRHTDTDGKGNRFVVIGINHHLRNAFTQAVSDAAPFFGIDAGQKTTNSSPP